MNIAQRRAERIYLQCLVVCLLYWIIYKLEIKQRKVRDRFKEESEYSTDVSDIDMDVRLRGL